MFERRLKVFLSILISVVALLLVRAFQLQVVTRGQWGVTGHSWIVTDVSSTVTAGRSGNTGVSSTDTAA